MKNLLSLTLIVLGTFTAAFSQTSNIVRTDLGQAEIDRIVKKLTENESFFRQSLNSYSFNRNATMQTIGMGGQISGQFRRDSFLTFNEAGERIEKILHAPVSTMTEIVITAADIENLGGLDPFAIEPAQAGKYNFVFIGKEKIDELDLLVFDVSPKVMPEVKKNMTRLFSGRIWVDDKDLFIVKSKGKAVPEGKERFPVIETWRENVDGKYWFPSYTEADEELVFENGRSVRLRVKVKYKNYSVGTSEVKIRDDVPEVKPSPSPTPEKP